MIAVVLLVAGPANWDGNVVARITNMDWVATSTQACSASIIHTVAPLRGVPLVLPGPQQPKSLTHTTPPGALATS